MLNKINLRINEISSEAEALVSRRSDLHNEIEKINVRIAHLVGAMHELDSLKRSLEDGQAEQAQG